MGYCDLVEVVVQDLSHVLENSSEIFISVGREEGIQVLDAYEKEEGKRPIGNRMKKEENGDNWLSRMRIYVTG